MSNISNKYSGPASSSFPLKLMEILDTREDLSDIISWLPHGRGFTIHDKKRFANEVLPQHFKVAQFTSFTRRMNRWRFTLQKIGNYKSNYFHPQFIKGAIRKCLDMRPKPQKVVIKKKPTSKIPTEPRKEMMTHIQSHHMQPFGPSSAPHHMGPPSFCSSSSFEMAGVQLVGPTNRNLLPIPLPLDKVQLRPEAINSTTDSNVFSHQYYIDYPPLPPSRDDSNYGSTYNNCYHAEQPKPHLESIHSTGEVNVLWGSRRPASPPPMYHQHHIGQNQFYRSSYDKALTETYAQHQAHLTRQLQLSHLTFMSIRSRASPNMPKCNREEHKVSLSSPTTSS